MPRRCRATAATANGVAKQLLQHYEHNCSQLQHSVMISTAASLLKVKVSGPSLG
jgi:hypothetical protein